ncbi:MAG TPA: NUDIX domain-containing protein [Solirubrobacteraceae bacterium]|nr:NUDIX domain-containing protein [Solirubrobacteraceae bacterium]
MTAVPGILARGPWRPSDVEVIWRERAFVPAPDATAAADLALEELRGRGSPSHDGLAGRLAGFASDRGRLRLECEPARWALRLLPQGAMQSLSALCVVRSADGDWLAGRRAEWVATWARRWALGAAGSVEVGEHPVQTLRRELAEEWSVTERRLDVEALVRMPNGAVMLVATAWLEPGARVTPDREHDEFAWWPREVSRWPEQADATLRALGRLLSEPGR